MVGFMVFFFPYIVRDDLEFFDYEMESLFIQIDCKVFQTPCNVIIGIVYRMPDSSTDIFYGRVADILKVLNKNNKVFYILGHLNIDRLKCDHLLWTFCTQTMYSLFYHKIDKGDSEHCHINRSHID